MIKIDNNKLEQVILNEMSDLEGNSPFLNSEICIYGDNDIQVLIKVTKDDSEFHDELNDEYKCISDI